jgi:hypothetical protein
VEPTVGLEPTTCCLRNGRRPVHYMFLDGIFSTTTRFFVQPMPYFSLPSIGLATFWLHRNPTDRPKSTPARIVLDGDSRVDYCLIQRSVSGRPYVSRRVVPCVELTIMRVPSSSRSRSSHRRCSTNGSTRPLGCRHVSNVAPGQRRTRSFAPANDGGTTAKATGFHVAMAQEGSGLASRASRK